MKQRQHFLGLEVDTGPYPSFIHEIGKLAKEKGSAYVCVANVHMLVEAYQEEEFAKVVNAADIVTPDGMPICLGLEHFYGIKQDRVAGMNLLPDLLTNAATKKIPVYIYGGDPKLKPLFDTYAQTHLPGLDLRGFYCPPFRPLSETEENQVIKQINDSGAQLILVSLGCPKQEKWMAAMKGRINGCMVGIGGAMPVMLGIKKRAPVWMQKASLEWLYRLIQEPARLHKRYLVTNTIFVYLYIKEFFNIRLKKK